MGEKAFLKTSLIYKFVGPLMFPNNCKALVYNHRLYLVLLIKSRTAFSLPAEQGKLHAVPVSFYVGLPVSSGLKLSEQSALFTLWFEIQSVILLPEKWHAFNVLVKNCRVDKTKKIPVNNRHWNIAFTISGKEDTALRFNLFLFYTANLSSLA